MRILELLMLLALLPVLVWPLLPWPRPRWVDYLPGTAVILMLIHLFLEGYRWQMLPAYALILVVFFATLSRLRYPAPTSNTWSGWMVAGSVVGLLTWAFALALPYLLPVARLPAATGPYAIGTQSYYLVDQSREEIYTDDPTDKREIMVQVWYPALADAGGEPAQYLEDLSVMGPVLAERLGLPTFLLDHINLVELDIQKGAPVLAQKAPYPVLIFSHGLRGLRVQNTAMVRELVSHGFVVAAIDHTFGNAITVFPDGRVAFYNPDVLSGKGDPPHTSSTLLEVWAADAGSVLDQLAAWNETAGHEFFNQLDLTRVGMFGHSTGGGAAVTFCAQDPRCKAGVGLDAWLVPVSPRIVDRGLAAPFFFLRADQWDFSDSDANQRVGDQLFASIQDTGYLATINGAHHYDFTDLPLLSPLAEQLGLSSGLDSRYLVEMMNSMTAAFFRQELKQEGDNLVMGAMVYPEMSLLGNGR